MTSQSAATLRSRYVEQAASDLEENRRRQRELAEKVAMLKQEEALLVDILTLAERYDGLSDPSRLPEQAQSEPASGQERHVTDSGRLPSGAAPQRLSDGDTARSGAKGKSRQPLLGDILIDLLGTHEEPCLAKEVRDELLEKHPDRAPTPQVVRNTLESLVAKGRVRRHRQQRSVMYTLLKPEERAGSGADAG
ncbi:MULTISPECIES: BlaI/MecI/CopY family transcriptional regulator [unclassified Streptomyces]|uniref:BlaI/MecI/CopY family transcriptional regulator n=1 Tax=unclassified Streptomyces TaxID=2593676 RepID=UPI0033BB45E7